MLYINLISLGEYFILVNIETKIMHFLNFNDEISIDYFLKYMNIYLYVLFLDNFCLILKTVLKSLKKVKAQTYVHYIFVYGISLPLYIGAYFYF